MAPPCDATTCPEGCCDSSGICQPGDTAAACGAAGAACASCEGEDVCTEGACQPSPCDATTCPEGCCDSSGICQPGDTAAACGAAGAACASCEGDDVCTEGACQPSPCDATTCPEGCCDSAGACQPGNTAVACGAAGAACASCEGEDVCTEGACVAPPCDATTCPEGCCDTSGVCQPGNSAAACGAAGLACVGCEGDNVCTEGACGPPPCDATTCPEGCCDSSGACQPGNTAAACGAAGAACSSCADENICTAGSCVECLPSQTEQEACGYCGTRERTCASDSTWSAWDVCSGEGECAAGAEETQACNIHGSRARSCGATCAWEPWSQCDYVPSFSWENVLAKGTNFARRVQVEGNDLWVGTSGGLLHSSDNGTTWSVLTSNDGLSGDSVSALLVFGHAVYVGSSQGLSYSTDRGASWATLTAADGLAGDNIKVVRRAPDGSLWVGTSSGVSHGSPQSGWVNYTSANGLVHDDVVDVAIGPNGSIWLAHDSVTRVTGLSVSSDNGQTWTNPSLPRPRNPVKALFFDSSNVLWVSTWVDGLFRSPDLGATWTQIKPLVYGTTSGSFVSSFYEYPNGTLWIGTQGSGPSGVSITTDSGTTWIKRNNLNNLLALSLDGDSSGRVFVTTWGGGLSWTDDQGATWASMPTQLGIPENQVTAVSRGPSGTIWIGTVQAFASYTADGGNTWTNVQWPVLGTMSKNVQHLFFDEAANTMWISTGNGLFSTSDMGATFSTSNALAGLGSNNVQGAFVSHVGGQTIYWAATSSGTADGAGGVSKSLDGITWTNHPRDNEQNGSNITNSVFVDSTGTVWAATESGLRFSTDQGANWTTWLYRLNSGLPAFEYKSVWVEQDGTLWV
ncbi:MAG TPA: hypothetical protein DFS52_13100, partial [Myxococcales bacterium]|nr:hypothetical protein [Myxococcales bacterium]